MTGSIVTADEAEMLQRIDVIGGKPRFAISQSEDHKNLKKTIQELIKE